MSNPKITQYPDTLYLYDTGAIDSSLNIEVSQDTTNDDVNINVSRQGTDTSAIKVSAEEHSKKVILETSELSIPDRSSENSLLVPRTGDQKVTIDQYDTLHEDKPDRHVNILDRLTALERDVAVTDGDPLYTNLVRQVIEEPNVEINDLAPFNSVGKDVRVQDGHGHSGWETVEIEIAGGTTVDDTFAKNAAETNENLSGTLGGCFVSWEEYAHAVETEYIIDKVYVTMNIEGALTDVNRTDLKTALSNDSICKLAYLKTAASDMTADVTGMPSRPGHGLPAPKKVAGEVVYGADKTISGDGVKRYMVSWYNFVRTHLVTLNSGAMAASYGISDGGDFAAAATNADFTGWQIITVDSSSNNSAGLFDNLKYTNTADWERTDDYSSKGTGIGKFEIRLNQIKQGSDASGHKDLVVAAATTVSYPRVWRWEHNDTVWVDYHSESVSDPSNSCDKHTKRHLVEWVKPVADPNTDVPDSGKYKVSITAGSEDVTLTPDGGLIAHAVTFKNQRHLDFGADYDYDDTDKTPMVMIGVAVNKVASAPASGDANHTDDIYFLNMARSQEVGKIIHNATKEIGVMVNDVSDHIAAVKSHATDGDDQVRGALNVRQADGDNFSSTNVVAGVRQAHSNNELIDLLGHGQSSNSVFLYEVPTESVLMRVSTGDDMKGLVDNVENDDYGYVLQMLVGDDDSKVAEQSELHPRHLIVTSYKYNDNNQWGSDVVHKLVNHRMLPPAPGDFKLLDYVQKHPHRVITDATAHVITVEGPNHDTTADAPATIKLMMLPMKMTNIIPLNDVGTQWNVAMTFLKQDVLASTLTAVSAPDTIKDKLTQAHVTYICKADAGIEAKKGFIMQIFGGGANDNYAMFMNGGAASGASDDKLFASYKIASNSDSASILLNDDNGESDLTDFVYFIHDVKVVGVGGNSVLTSDPVDIVSAFANADATPLVPHDTLVLELKHYNLVDKDFEKDGNADKIYSVEIQNEIRSFPSVDVTAASRAIDDAADAISGATTNTAASDAKILNMLSASVGDEPEDAAGSYMNDTDDTDATASIWGNLKVLHADWGSQYNAAYLENSAGAINAIDNSVDSVDNLNNHNTNTAFTAAAWNLSAANSMKFNVTESNRFNVTNLPSLANRGQLYQDDLDDLEAVVTAFKTDTMNKIKALYATLQNGYDLADTANVRDQYGYYTLQEYIADAQTVMQDVEQTLLKEWRDVADGEGVNIDQSIRGIVNNFSVALDAAMTDFDSAYRTATEKVKTQHATYIEELQKHENDIHLYNSLAAAMIEMSKGDGSGATATATIDSNGVVTGISVNNRGSGYTSATTVSIVGGGGHGATATAILNPPGEVTAITVDNGGSGYTSAPTVSISSATAPTESYQHNAVNTRHKFYDSMPADEVRDLYDGSTDYGTQPYENFTEDMTSDQKYTVQSISRSGGATAVKYYYWITPTVTYKNRFSIANGSTFACSGTPVTVVGDHNRAVRILVVSNSSIGSEPALTGTSSALVAYTDSDNVMSDGVPNPTMAANASSEAYTMNLGLTTAAGAVNFGSHVDGSGSAYLATVTSGMDSKLANLVWHGSANKVLNVSLKPYLLDPSGPTTDQIVTEMDYAGNWQSVKPSYDVDATGDPAGNTSTSYDVNTYSIVASSTVLESNKLSFVHIRYVYVFGEYGPAIKFNGNALDYFNPTVTKRTTTYDSDVSDSSGRYNYDSYDVSALGVDLDSITLSGGTTDAKYNILIQDQDGGMSSVFHYASNGNFNSYVTPPFDAVYVFADDTPSTGQLVIATSSTSNLNADGDEESTNLSSYKDYGDIYNATKYEMLVGDTNNILRAINVTGATSVLDDEFTPSTRAVVGIESAVPADGTGNLTIQFTNAHSSQSWIGVYDSDYDNWDLAVAANTGDPTPNTYVWQYVDGTDVPGDDGVPAADSAIAAQLTLNIGGLADGPYNVVMFKDASESEIQISNTVTYTKP